MRFLALWLAFLISPACTASFPTPATAAEVTDSGVTQGLAGKAFVRVGSCAAGCGGGNCSVVPIGGFLVISENAVQLPGPDCLVFAGTQRAMPGTLFDAGSSTTVALSAAPFFVSLDAGEYGLWVSDGMCSTCVTGPGPDGGICSGIRVAPGTVTRHDLFLDVSAQ